MKFLSTTRPILFVFVIRDDTHTLAKLIEILLSLGIFIWQHKDAFLRLVNNLNSTFDYLQVMKQTIREAYLYWQYQFSILKNPIPYLA